MSDQAAHILLSSPLRIVIEGSLLLANPMCRRVGRLLDELGAILELSSSTDSRQEWGVEQDGFP